MRALKRIAFLVVLVACQSTPPPSPSAPPVATASRERATTVYENTLLAYRVMLPSAYRRSECLSTSDGRFQTPVPFAVDTFVPRTDQDEVELGPRDAMPWSVLIEFFTNREGADSLRWAQTHGRQRDGQRLETLTIGGLPAVRKAVGDMTVEYDIVDRGRTIQIARAQAGDPADRKPAAAIDGAIDRIGRSLELLPTIYTVPSPTPANPDAPRAAEAAVDALADALERSDYAALDKLVKRKCWWLTAVQGQEATWVVPSKLSDWLRARTTDGKLKVTVERRPLLVAVRGLPPGQFSVVSRWSDFDGRPAQVAQMVIGEEDGVWRWTGALFGIRAQ